MSSNISVNLAHAFYHSRKRLPHSRGLVSSQQPLASPNGEGTHTRYA